MNVRFPNPIVPAALAAACLAGLAADLDAQRGRFRRRPDAPQQQAPAPAAEPEAKEQKVESWTAIVGGDVHVGNGTVLRRATVLIGDDKIHGVGYDEIDVPEDAKVVDATGKVVAPGFCIVKASGFGTPRSGSSVKDGLNPFDPSIKLGLAAGITSFLWQSGSGSDTPGGNAALVKLHYGDLDGMVASEDGVVSMRVPLNPQQIRNFRKLVADTIEYRKQLDAAADEEAKKKIKAPRNADAILAIMKGEKRLWISLGGSSGSERVGHVGSQRHAAGGRGRGFHSGGFRGVSKPRSRVSGGIPPVDLTLCHGRRVLRLRGGE